MWTILGISAAVALFAYRKQRSAAWGGLAFGVVVGAVLATISAIRGNGFDLQLFAKAGIIGVLLGFGAELLGALGDRFRKSEQAGLEEQLREAKADLTAATTNLEAAFPLWWADQLGIDGGIDEALNLFIDEHHLQSPSDASGSTTLRYPEAKLRIIEHSNLALDNPEDESMLDRYKMSLMMAKNRIQINRNESRGV